MYSGQNVTGFAGPSTCYGCGLYSRASAFLAEPFTTAASKTEWVLFVGMILVAAYIWRDILKHIESLV